MARVSAVIHIDASPERVWEVATDLDRMGQWVSIHQEFPGPHPDDLKAGSCFRQTLGVAGITFHVEWTATEVERPGRLVWDGVGPAGTSAHTSYELDDERGGTRFTYRNEFTLPAGMLGKGAGRIVAGQAERQLNKSLEKLKELIEK